MSSEDYLPPEQLLLSDLIREKVLELFEHKEESKDGTYDFEQLFARILSEKDWTDKLASIFDKIRNRFRLRNTNTKLSVELTSLIPDMNEVAKAYDEMTSGYKEFIRKTNLARTLTDPSDQPLSSCSSSEPLDRKCGKTNRVFAKR